MKLRKTTQDLQYYTDDEDDFFIPAGSIVKVLTDKEALKLEPDFVSKNRNNFGFAYIVVESKPEIVFRFNFKYDGKLEKV